MVQGVDNSSIILHVGECYTVKSGVDVGESLLRVA
jgi:hypothetical protein